jgi:Ion channel
MESSGRADHPVRDRCEPHGTVISVATMFRRFLHAVKYAAKEESFAAIAGAAISLVLVGTITYSLGEGWNVADGFYFAVCTLTTSSIADPDLTLTHEALKIFTALYVLTGIGILVEVARQLGVGFVKLRADQSATRHARRHKDDPPETHSTE